MPFSYSDDRNTVQREDLLAWGTVRAGLALAFVGGLLSFISLFVIVVVVVTTAGQPQGRQALTVFVQMGCMIGLISGLVLSVTGACMSCAAPPETGVRAWGVGTCIFVAIGLALISVLMIAKVNAEEVRLGPGLFPGGKPGPAPQAPFTRQEELVLGYTSQGAYLLGVGSFLLAMRGIARHFGRRGLAITAVGYLLFYFSYVIGLNVLNSMKEKMTDPSQVQALTWIVLGGFVLLAVWGIVLVALVRGALTRGMLRV